MGLDMYLQAKSITQDIGAMRTGSMSRSQQS